MELEQVMLFRHHMVVEQVLHYMPGGFNKSFG
jgi:hypothetical protein